MSSEFINQLALQSLSEKYMSVTLVQLILGFKNMGELVKLSVAER